MKRKLSNVSCKYGGPLGRASDSSLSGKVRLVRVCLDKGGYDEGGAYWGIGEPVWWAEDRDGNTCFLRAPNREAAKAKLVDCRFYR